MIQIYSPSNTDYTHNGDCVLMPTRCEITAEINGAWSLQLEHPIDDDGRWRYIEENAVLKVPTWMVNKLQRYRIREVEKTDTMIAATAYPVFFDSRDDAYIFDIRISNKTGQQALTQLLTAAPAKYSASSDLVLIRQSEVFQNCNLLEAITGPFRERWGGEILYDNNTVVVNQTIGGDYGVTVEYGKNIVGVNYTVDTTDMATRIIPYAYNGRQMSGASPWVDSSLIATYPKVFIRAMQFDDIKLAEDASDDDLTDDSITVCQTQADLDTALTAAVNRQYSVENLDKPKVSMSIDMVSLEDTDEYRDFSSLEEIRLGDTVHCKHSKLGIITDASVVSITWDCARDRIAAVVLGDFAFDFVRDSGLDEIRMGIEQMAANLNADGSLMAERIKGLLDGMVCQLNAQYTAAKRQDVMAILFENLDPQSPLYGALGIGTQGFQISKERTQDGKGWVWTTAATADGIVADTVVTGTISDKAGISYWDLDNGDMSIVANSFKLVSGGSQKTIQELIEEGTSGNLLIDPIGLSTDYWTIHGTLTTGQTDPLGGTNAVMLTPASDEGYIQARKDTNTPFDTMGSKYRLTVWLKASQAATYFDDNPIRLHFNRVASDDIFPTTTWQQYSMELDVSSIAIGDIVTIGGFGSFTPADGYDLYVYEPRVEKILTDEEVFNMVSDYGETQGIWVAENGKLYINMQYLRSGTAKIGGLRNENGLIEVYDNNKVLRSKIDNEGFWFTPTGNFRSSYVKLTDGGMEGFQLVSGQNRGGTKYGFEFAQNAIDAVIYFMNNLRFHNSPNAYDSIIIKTGQNSGIYIYDNIRTNVNFDEYVVISGRNGSTGYGLNVYHAANFQGGIMTTNIWYSGSLIPTGNSDKRLKTNIAPTDADIIDELNVVQFDWKKDGKHVSAGLIAQDVEQVLPELVNHESKEGYLGLDYVGLIPHLVKKCQQQQQEIDSLKAEIAEIKAIMKGVCK